MTPAHSPTCLLREDNHEYQLLFQMRDGISYDLNLMLSQDRKRLHVLARNHVAPEQDEYLWSFQLPNLTRPNEMNFEQHDSLFLLHIPKNKYHSKHAS